MSQHFNMRSYDNKPPHCLTTEKDLPTARDQVKVAFPYIVKDKHTLPYGKKKFGLETSYLSLSSPGKDCINQCELVGCGMDFLPSQKIVKMNEPEFIGNISTTMNYENEKKNKFGYYSYEKRSKKNSSVNSSYTFQSPKEQNHVKLFMQQSDFISSLKEKLKYYPMKPCETREISESNKRLRVHNNIFLFFLWKRIYSFIDVIIHNFFYDPENPEFTSLQQNAWAVVLGIFMGIFTAKWGEVIEFCVEIVWTKIPEKLLEWGIFTDLNGSFPLPHYVWICPALTGGVLSYISAILPIPIPDQNEWIESLHRVGVMDHSTFIQLILISTAGMASGLSLGPELPLVLSSGMIGSYLSLKTKQSVLSARVMNLTAAAAAIGGFFGFPMAGALFVLEIPHRMGLQYFEALSPATIASIAAVLVNRMVTGDDVKGYFNYPFLKSTLPSHIFYVAIIYGVIGSIVGVIYTGACVFMKNWVHDWFHCCHMSHGDIFLTRFNETQHNTLSEDTPLVGESKLNFYRPEKKNIYSRIQIIFSKFKVNIGIKHEPTRAALAGILAGIIVGFVCMLVPHSLFWGEAQLQTLIDKGRTPLPVFGHNDEPTSILTAYGYCLVDSEDKAAISKGFSLGCAGVIATTKIIVIGLSLGTGIVGGHFWGPLYVGCAASHFFTGLVSKLNELFGLGEALNAYPCVAVLCIMGSTHIVTFRAHMAIMLILTLTIRSFTSEFDSAFDAGGDYSAVFPLLVVACFVPLMFTRSTIFYEQQRSRGDIIASPEVLCEPRKEGTPEYPIHQGVDCDEVSYGYRFCSDDVSFNDYDYEGGVSYSFRRNEVEPNVVLEKIKNRTVQPNFSYRETDEKYYQKQKKKGDNWHSAQSIITIGNTSKSSSSVLSLEKLDEEKPGIKMQYDGRKTHRRIKSGSDVILTNALFINSNTVSSFQPVHLYNTERKTIPLHSSPVQSRSRDNSIERRIRRNSSRDGSCNGSRAGTPNSERLSRVNSYGEIHEFQPPLMHQARERASSVNRRNMSNSGVPPKVRYIRNNNDISLPFSSALPDQI